MKREAYYESLARRFAGIERALNEEQRAELDGLLWDFSGEVCGTRESGNGCQSATGLTPSQFQTELQDITGLR